ncbi:putative pyridoxal-dependent aspartate 1-decarboxylase [Saccharobesus litoralis]|uniref:Putative pyridoxal-dependent aspartate 1-decarboxylase n=1 Tax=Saccharobesus litoralis TaxID=2172099 RepID=A0A2S0VXQ3_9ALTE|nr:putative pyridoxal-dependent aspartate 1-decarboxylase [Saccharobesus litoralis]AWB68994.1 putative pyridoxal-dependent aspartate 1-decarboxylase [Saccharobesus litoralis]
MRAETNKQATANEESLLRIFTVPEAPDSTLGRIEQEISQNLNGFLSEHLVAKEHKLSEIEKDFSDAQLPEEPQFVSDHTSFLLDKLVAQSVHTSSPSFIGHMTSALPYFMLPMSKIMIALNQNLVKIETSKAFTPLERQVLGMMHNLVYGGASSFYQEYMHSEQFSLGAFCSGGTIANVTALWVARNNLFKPSGNFKGVAQSGLYKALLHYGYKGAAVLVSERGHYSLAKSADLLGIGREDVIAIPTDANNRVDIDKLRSTAKQLRDNGIAILAMVGVAGTTETGNIDPLAEMAAVASEVGCHFHVDAAWGGSTLFSHKYASLLAGIELADSVTIDAHKQMYVPMGAGIVLFKDPSLAGHIEHHAEYVLRKGSKDLGSHTLEGSRPGMAMLVFASMNILGRKGYQLLIDRSIEQARYFAELINQQDDFELVSHPELCLLTYRYVPAPLKAILRSGNQVLISQVNEYLDDLTKYVQKRQREAGKSFVSRTRINPSIYQGQSITVFRVVLANPLTTQQILQDVLQEQRELAQTSQIALPMLMKMLAQWQAA